MSLRKKYLSWAIFAVTPILTFYLTQNLFKSTFGEVSISLQLVNWLLFEIAAFFLTAVFGKAKYALIAEMFFCWFCGMADAYVYNFRGTYITPPDIASVQTAINVAGNFNYMPNARMTVSTIFFIMWGAVIMLFCDVDFRGFLGSIRKRVAVSILLALCFMAAVRTIQADIIADIIGIHNSMMNINNVTEKNGMFLGFLFKMKYLKEKKPAGYSAEEEKKILDDIRVEGSVPEELPDIVVIMDEAFSDLKVDVDFGTNEDYMPFIHSLQEGGENVITGYLDVSVNGGKTANTEFEFLTGHTIGFLTFEAIPYMTYLKKPMDALGWYLQGLGYQTIAMHPYDGNGWYRDTVWLNLGFSTTRFKEYFKEFNPEYVRDYISDRAHFKQIEYELDNREDTERPMFSFNVTMQNHTGYGGDPENFERTIFVDGISDHGTKEAKRLENYLSLVRLTDDALREFTEDLKKSDRDTIVVFFGDHQPSGSVLQELYRLNGKDVENLSWEEDMNRYKVPFVIWANYDIVEESGLETSANYLGNLVLKTAGIPLTKYRTFTDEFSRDYPIVTYERYVDSKGDAYPMDSSAEGLESYHKMEYYEIFDDHDSYY